MDPIARREVKYCLPAARVPALRADLSRLLAPDAHGEPGVGYAVRSVYFESGELRVLREKLGGLLDRVKLRVRGYPPLTPEDRLTLELKRKHGDWIVKERAPCSAEELDLLLAGRCGELLARRPGDPVVRRFVAAKATLGAALPLQVEYRREAFLLPAPGVYLRATIDRELRYSVRPAMAAEGPVGQPFAHGQAILEIKTSGPPPSWLPTLLRRHGLDPRTLSKFAGAALKSYARVD